MRPDDPRNTGPIVPQRQSPPVGTGGQALDQTSARSNEAAANIVRDQISSLYQSGGYTPAKPATQPTAEPEPSTAPASQVPVDDDPNPYDRTHSDAHSINAAEWQQYHSAWQTYYQKYYERYYVSHVHHAKQQLESRLQNEAPRSAAETFSNDEAVHDLRAQLRRKLRTTATKVRSHKLFVPLTGAAAVMVVFAFLQFNQSLIAPIYAYTQPARSEEQSFIPTTASDVQVGPAPLLSIPKFNINVPVDFNAKPDHASQMAAMVNGVAYFGIPGANSKPGQLGNVAISGHSSNDFFEQGNYKFIFGPLVAQGMKEGDPIYVNYESRRYTYSVTRSEIVMPNEANKLILPADKPYLTLITCTPLGTSEKRLLIFAEQISPSPAQALPAPAQSAGAAAAMPGNAPSVLERLMGAR